MSSEVTTTGDSQEVQDLFSRYCDKDSLIDRKTIESMPPFAEMLAEEDLLEEELDEIWEAAQKSAGDSSRLNLLSFMKIYDEVDDLFEDDDDGVEKVEDIDDDNNSDSTAAENDVNDLDEELSNAYKSLTDENGLISKDKMMQWEEIESLFEEGLLGEDEFEELWNAALEKSTKNGDKVIDIGGFSVFNMGLDDLFVLEDDDEPEEEESTTTTATKPMVTEGDMPPAVLFSQLADKNYLVGMKQLTFWTELKELLEDGDLLINELQEIYDKFATPESSGKLNEDGFLQFYDEIDALFEEVDDDEEEDAESLSPPTQQTPRMNTRVKGDLLAFIDLVIEDDEEPCGFGTSESDQEQILNIVQVLEQQPSNMILQKDGNIEQVDVAGKWELLYTSSSAMKFNQGLSGIGGSFPNGKFGNLRQELKATKFISDMEYKERVEVTPSSASFDVTVTGLWDLQKSVSIFTGQPTVILNVEPDRVIYGLSSTRGDHWKSLGPVNRLDLSYLDDDLRVMRGCTSSDTLFIFKKIKE